MDDLKNLREVSVAELVKEAKIHSNSFGTAELCDRLIRLDKENSEMRELLSKIRDDLLMRGELASETADVTVVDLSGGLWGMLNDLVANHGKE